MNSLLYDKPELSFAEDFANKVLGELNDIKHTFFRIGFRLREANDFKYYKELGFESIADCAEALFGFKKTTTYDLMNIALMFKDDDFPMRINKYYDRFSQSQLVVLSSMGSYERDFLAKICSSSDTVAEMRRAKKYLHDSLFRGDRHIPNWEWSQCKSLAELNKLFDSRFAGIPAPTAPNCSKEVDYAFLQSIIDKIPKDDVVVEHPAPEQIVIAPESVAVSETVAQNSGYPEKFIDIISIKLSEKLFSDGFVYQWREKQAVHQMMHTDEFSKYCLVEICRIISKEYTMFKHLIQDCIKDWAAQFDYGITLCGRKQGMTHFAGNIASLLCDEICKPFSNLKSGKN